MRPIKKFVSGGFSLFRHIARRVVFIGISVILFFASLAIAGFCPGAMRILDEAELIDAAASEAMSSNQIYREASSEFFAPSNPLAYTNLDEFHRLNPNCCKLINDIEVDGLEKFVSRVFGYRRAVVEVRYLVRYVDEHGRVLAEPTVKRPVVSNCGIACFDC